MVLHLPKLSLSAKGRGAFGHSGTPDRRGGFVQKGKQQASVRITDQYRDRRGMVYDFKCAGVGVSISISASSEDQTDWRAEVTTKLDPPPPVVCGTGPSREAALRVAADAWTEKGETDGLPPLDWEAIRGALVTVRAI
jgi:hypothetical protein